jgi:hypothetical protein
MAHSPRFTVTAAVLGAPDPRALAAFYRDLLGWPVGTDEDDVLVHLDPAGHPFCLWTAR